MWIEKQEGAHHVSRLIRLLSLPTLCRIGPEKRGGLNVSTQHLLKVFLQGSTRLISFAGINSNKTKPCLGPD
jgi:hypothetical protein